MVYTPVIGADPGLTGGLAFLCAGLVDARPMPTRTESRGKKIRAVINPQPVLTAFRGWYDAGARTVIIERVGGLPGQSAARGFSFGEGCGVLRACAEIAGLRVAFVEPAIWRAKLGVRAAVLPGEKDSKAASRRVALQHFPNAEYLFKRKKDDGLWEAALLALYGERFLT